jgi:hypothetical protein
VTLALVVVAVRDDHDGAPKLVPRLVLGKLVAAGEVDGVVERRAAARAQAADGRLQLLGIVDEVRHQLGRSIEAHHHGFVVAEADHAVDERIGRFLLELETLPDAVAGIDQDAEAQGKVGFGRELRDGLGALVFEHLKVVLHQVGDEAALLVGDREKHVDARDVQNDAGTGIFDDLGLLRGRRNRLLRLHGSTARGHGRQENEGFHLD